MQSTTTLTHPLTSTASSVVDCCPPASESLCSFCEDGALYRPEDGPPDVATVRYADTLACGFHAVFLWGDQAAREFKGLFP
jgi:hypothetical protein